MHTPNLIMTHNRSYWVVQIEILTQKHLFHVNGTTNSNHTKIHQ